MKIILYIMRLYIISLLLLGAMPVASLGSHTYRKVAGGVAVDIGNTKDSEVATVRLQVYGDKIIRVSATPDSKFADEPSLAVLDRPTDVRYDIEETDSTVSVVTSAIRATVALGSGDVRFYDKEGKLILAEADGGREFAPIEVEGTKGYTVRQTFRSLSDEEGIYGLGQHQSDEFNYKGKNEEIYQYNTKVSFPFVVSTDNYGILWYSYSL